MFLYLHDIGEKRLKNLMKHFKKNGLTGRTHGNTSRQPHNAHSLSTVNAVVTFILNYSEQNSLALPGRIPGYSRSDIQLNHHHHQLQKGPSGTYINRQLHFAHQMHLWGTALFAGSGAHWFHV